MLNNHRFFHLWTNHNNQPLHPLPLEKIFLPKMKKYIELIQSIYQMKVDVLAQDSIHFLQL